MNRESILIQMGVPGKDGIFVLGSFERRVTFYSQQLRAMNLVDAVRHKYPKEHRLLVIGAGIGGLTAAAAAARRGFDVTVVEKNAEPMLNIKGCKKRWVHPRIYEWPNEDESPNDPDARLPLLTWQAETAGVIQERIHDAWRPLVESRRVEVVYSATNIDIELGRDQGPWMVSWVPTPAAGPAFDVVIVAIGFGEEKSFRCTRNKSYWHDDELDQIDGRVFISGCGDGGLIDMIRACVDRFQHESLVDRFSLNDPQFKDLREHLLWIDREAQKNSDPTWLEDRYKALETPFGTSIKAIDEALRGSLKQGLKDRMRDGKPNILSSEYPTPYSLGASMLHRFVMSCLIRIGAVKYEPVRITDNDVRASDDDLYEVKLGAQWVKFARVVCRQGTDLQAHFRAQGRCFEQIFDICQEKLREGARFDLTRARTWERGVFGGERGARWWAAGVRGTLFAVGVVIVLAYVWISRLHRDASNRRDDDRRIDQGELDARQRRRDSAARFFARKKCRFKIEVVGASDSACDADRPHLNGNLDFWDVPRRAASEDSDTPDGKGGRGPQSSAFSPADSIDDPVVCGKGLIRWRIGFQDGIPVEVDHVDVIDAAREYEKRFDVTRVRSFDVRRADDEKSTRPKFNIPYREPATSVKVRATTAWISVAINDVTPVGHYRCFKVHVYGRLPLDTDSWLLGATFDRSPAPAPLP